jgi:predicted membrane chloride channel (bestrophin family)
MVCLIIVLKIAAHFLGLEMLSLSPLFSGIIAANVFLMGFLISGVLADYKESEKLPGELAVSIQAVRDEAHAILRAKQAEAARDCLAYTGTLVEAILDWFNKKRPKQEVFGLVRGLNDYYTAFEPLTAPPFIARLKQEQTNLRRMITRCDVIRETDFVTSGYVIAELTTILLCIGLIVTQFAKFHESMFFVFVISFFLLYLLALIRSLDNPFDYSAQGSFENVELAPLEELAAEIRGERV